MRRVTVLPSALEAVAGIPDGATLDAMRLAARTEGMVTDPVYEGKSMAALIDLVGRREIRPDATVLYAHLGGQPAINAYSALFFLTSPPGELGFQHIQRRACGWRFFRAARRTTGAGTALPGRQGVRHWHHGRRVRLPQILVGLTRMKCAGTPSTHGSRPASMNGVRSASASR